MKKILIILSVIAVLATVFACTADNGEQEELKNKTYKVAVDGQCPPFSMKDKNGEYYGISVDLFKAVAMEQKLDYEFVETPTSAAEESIDKGNTDIFISGVKLTANNKKAFDFTGPYIQSGVVMFTSQNNNKINSKQDLSSSGDNKKKVAVLANTDAEEYAKELALKYDFEIVTFSTVNDVLSAVMSNNCVAGFEEKICINYALTENLPIKILGSEEYVRSYAYALKKDIDEDLIGIFDNGLERIINSGVYETLVSQYVIDN